MSLLDAPAFWAFVGGVGYAGTRLSTALWGGREIGQRARAHAVAQFVISLILAPAAGHVMAPVILHYLPRGTPQAMGLAVGLAFNAVWPILVEPKFIRRLLADMARGLADRLSNGDTR